jgi:uncharacterized protein (UPF0332 family)
MSGSPVFSNRFYFFSDGQQPYSISYIKAIGRSYTRACTTHEFERVFGCSPFSFCSRSVSIPDLDLLEFTGSRHNTLIDLGVVLRDARLATSVYPEKPRIEELLKYFESEDSKQPHFTEYISYLCTDKRFTSFSFVVAKGKPYKRACTLREFNSVFLHENNVDVALNLALLVDRELSDFMNKRSYGSTAIIDLDSALKIAQNASRVYVDRIDNMIKNLASLDAAEKPKDGDKDELNAFIERAEQRIEEQVNEYRKKLVEEFRKEVDDRLTKRLKTKN